LKLFTEFQGAFRAFISDVVVDDSFFALFIVDSSPTRVIKVALSTLNVINELVLDGTFSGTQITIHSPTRKGYIGSATKISRIDLDRLLVEEELELPSDVLSMKHEPTLGLLFVGTSDGLVSFTNLIFSSMM
jgi:hypothetical protein